MSHKNYFLDFTVGTFIIHDHKCLLCHHRNMNQWLPVGGHIDENETPDRAAVREALEESGLKIALVGERADIKHELVQTLVSPIFADKHYVRHEHWHYCLFYAAVPEDKEPKITLDKSEHLDLNWFTCEEIDKLSPILPTVQYYAKFAIKMIENRT